MYFLKLWGMVCVVALIFIITLALLIKIINTVVSITPIGAVIIIFLLITLSLTVLFYK